MLIKYEVIAVYSLLLHSSTYNLQAENIMNFMWECLQIAVF